MTIENPKIKTLFAKDLSLSLDNPRFPKAVHSEEEAILTFFSLKKVGQKKIENIIEDIAENKYVFEDFIILEKDGKYIVHDGNRRLTALKLFLDDYLELIKDKYPKTYKFVKLIKEEFDISKLPLTAKIYTDQQKMATHVLKLHLGEQNGTGQIKWDTKESDSYQSKYFDRDMKIGNQIYKYLEKASSKKALYQKIKDENYATTFTRMFGFSDIKKRIFLLPYGKQIDINNQENFEKICEMIDYFVSQEAKVGDVYTKEDAAEFFSVIMPINKIDDKVLNPDGNINPAQNEPDTLIPLNNDDIGDIESDKNNPIDITPDRLAIPNDIVDIKDLPEKNNDNIGRPRKNPEEFDYLLKAYAFKNKYTSNARINQIIREMSNIRYKENVVSSMFLIRTILETYVNDYIDYFASLDRFDPLKLKNISSDRNKRTKTLRLLIFEDIYNHLKNTVQKFPETYELIQTTFTDNNNTSTMQIIHFHVHSAATIPDSVEILDAWRKISHIIKSLDILLSENVGQK